MQILLRRQKMRSNVKSRDVTMWDSEVVLFIEVEKRKTGKLIVVRKQKAESEKFTLDVETLESESRHESVP